MSDTAPRSLQETILACLTFHDKAGTSIAAQVAPEHFDETYREIAEKVLAYRRKYQRAPGIAHLDDLFDRHIQAKDRTHQLLSALSAIAPSINIEYAISRAGRFVREQTLKAALVEASSRWEQGGEEVSQDIEAILHRALKNRVNGFDVGTFLSDEKRALKFLDRKDTNGTSFGIRQLDTLGINLRPKELTLYIAPKGTGKSWSAVHVGKQGILAGKSVLHITNELSEELTAQRYLQACFAGSTHDLEFARTELELNKDDKLLKLVTNEEAKPTWNFFSSGPVRQELRKSMRPWGTKFRHVVIKEFPSGALTVPHLEAYLDYLDQEHKFNPHILIIDSPDVMSQDIKNYRISVGRTYVSIRGILVDRHIAGYCTTQGNRSSLRATKVTTDMVSEDLTKIQTADTVFTYSRTPAERERNLARLFVANARTTRDEIVVVMAQSYDTGQYVLPDATVVLNDNYWDQLKIAKEDE